MRKSALGSYFDIQRSDVRAPRLTKSAIRLALYTAYWAILAVGVMVMLLHPCAWTPNC